MDEGPLTKALFAGVSLFIAVITISAIIAYYNVARDSIKTIGSGADFEAMYRTDIEDILLSTGTNKQITGTQVKNLLNYYYDNNQVEITVTGMKYVAEDGSVKEYSALSCSTTDDTLRNVNYNIIMKNIIDNQKFTLENNSNNNERIILMIRGE